MSEGLKLLFLHGAGGTSSKWRKLEDDFKGVEGLSYQVIDLPGHGKAFGEVLTSIKKVATFLNKGLKEDVIIIGHSMGGLIGIELAARSEHVKGLVLANSHFELPVHPKIIEKLSGPTFPESFFRASYAENVDADLLTEEKDELKLNSPATVLADFISCSNYKFGKGLIRKLTIPILAIYGSEDRLLPKDAEEELRMVVAGDLSIEKIAGAGHYSMLEKSEEFAEKILAFKKRVEG